MFLLVHVKQGQTFLSPSVPLTQWYETGLKLPGSWSRSFEILFQAYVWCKGLCIFNLSFIKSGFGLCAGCMLCFGQSAFFRFNHPEEAFRLKSMMPERGQTASVKNWAHTGNAISHRRAHLNCGMNYPTLTTTHSKTVLSRMSFVWKIHTCRTSKVYFCTVWNHNTEEHLWYYTLCCI